MRKLFVALLLIVFLAPAVSAVIAACGSVAASDTLAGNISGAGTCLTITASDVEIDCLGFTIEYKTGGGINGFGITAANKTNITVRNCIIDAGSTAGAFGHALQLINLSNSTIVNNTMLTNGTFANFGMNVTNSTNFTVVNNTIVTESSGLAAGSIAMQIGRSSIVNISSNRIFTYFDDSNFGISLLTINHSLVANNLIRTGNVSSNFGVFTANSLNITIDSNDIVTTGDSSNFGIFADTTTLAEFGNISITRNNITAWTSDSSNFGIDIRGLNGVVIQNNTIRTNGSDSNFGIATTNFIGLRARNITIQSNSIVTDGNDCCNYGVSIDDTENTTVAWNVISTNGSDSNEGVILTGITFNITVANNSILANGTDPFTVSVGVDSSGGANTTIFGNNITTNGTSINEGIFTNEDNQTIVNNFIITDGSADTNIGIEVTSSSFSTIINNTIFTNGTSDNYGLLIQIVSENNTVENNTIFTDGSSSDNYGMFLFDADNNSFVGNLINTNGTAENHGIFIDSTSHNNSFSMNNISTSGTASYGINITGSSNLLFNHTLLIDPVQWIFSTATGFANYSNTTFFMLNGSIRYNGTFALAGLHNITHNILNISFNNSFVNSTAEPSLNTTAQITLNDLPFASPDPAVDFEDDGTFAACTSPQCEEVSFAGGDFIFNVSSFTSYAATEGSAPENITFNLSKTDSQDPVNVSSTLNYTIVLTVNGTAFNISLTDIYPGGVSFVNASPAPDAGNDTWIIGNLTNSSFEINITITIGSSFANGTVINNTANISFQNSTGGIISANVTENTTVEVPPIPPAPPSGSGGGSGGGPGPSVCPVYCKDPKYANVVICQNYPCKLLEQPAPQQTTPAVQKPQSTLPTPIPIINSQPIVEHIVEESEQPAIVQTQAARESTTSYKLMYTLFIVFALAAIAGFAAFAHMHHKKR